MYHIKLLGHNTQRKKEKVKMSQDLLATVHQVLSSDDLEIQELVQRISSARSLDEETKDIIIKEISDAMAKRAAQKAGDRVASGERRNVSGTGSKREKDFQKKSARQSDKFSKYAAMKDKEKGVGSRTKDPKRKKELIDKAKAAGSAAKAASNYATKREKEGTSGSVAYEEISPETSFDPGEASANVELPKGSFVAQVAAHLSGQRQ